MKVGDIYIRTPEKQMIDITPYTIKIYEITEYRVYFTYYDVENYGQHSFNEKIDDFNKRFRPLTKLEKVIL